MSPIILNVVGKSKKAAFERSIDGIIEAVRIDLSDDDFLTPREYFYEGSSLSLLTVNDKKRDEIVKISGRIDGNGFIYVDGDGNIIINNICNKEYCANGKEEEIEISKNPTGEVPDLNKEDPVISLNGDSTIYVELNGIYKELGAVARTKAGDSLEYTTEIKKNNEVVESIDTSIEGTYIITYRTSNNERTVSVEREVAVLNMLPMITMTESSESYEQEKEVLITVSGVRPNKVTGFSYEIKKDGESISRNSVLGLTKTLILNETGIYEVIVTVTDNNSHTNTLSKIYKIDLAKPSITVPENTEIKITEVTEYDLMTGVVVSDNVDPNPTAETIGGLSAILGEQTVTYKVVDEAGNEESIVRKFTVVEAEGPILNFSNRGSELWTQDQTITVTATDNSNIKTFTYEVIKDDVSKGIQNVNVSGKSAEVDIKLNESGIYSIKLTGSVVCKSGSTTVANTSSLAVGTHTITCVATGNTGLKKSASKTIIVKTAIADTTGANKPTLTNGLIPIKWNGSTWIRADESNKSGANQWYDYNTQMWANAASVTSDYRNAAVGSTIPESAINAYFVWIPRYEYQYTNLSASYAGGSAVQPDQININFIATSKTSPSSNYKIHPAFNFGGTELAGIWVGKFETTGSASTPTIKPNLSSLRDQDVSTQFATAQRFSASGNSYGISTSADAHMMKNSEWGAVAYLSQSKYGKRGNSSYSGANKEVYQNKSGSYITGCSSGAPGADGSYGCAYTYEKSIGGTGASTSGTIYGVYDMSGGAYKYVMGVYSNTVGTSGFSSLPNSKYYDNYTSSSTTYYGHALSETSGWYSDSAIFVNSVWTWFIRGGVCGHTAAAGVFNFSYGTGVAFSSYSFRVVVLG